jgi:hypothetical protein
MSNSFALREYNIPPRRETRSLLGFSDKSAKKSRNFRWYAQKPSNLPRNCPTCWDVTLAASVFCWLICWLFFTGSFQIRLVGDCSSKADQISLLTAISCIGAFLGTWQVRSIHVRHIWIGISFRLIYQSLGHIQLCRFDRSLVTLSSRKVASIDQLDLAISDLYRLKKGSRWRDRLARLTTERVWPQASLRLDRPTPRQRAPLDRGIARGPARLAPPWARAPCGLAGNDSVARVLLRYRFAACFCSRLGPLLFLSRDNNAVYVILGWFDFLRPICCTR